MDLFLDLFNGTAGSLVSHVPDVGGWSASTDIALQLDGLGRVYSNTDNHTAYLYPTTTIPHNSITVQVDFSVSTIPTGADDYVERLYVELWEGSAYGSIELHSNDSGSHTLYVSCFLRNGSTGISLVPAFSTILSNTSHSVRFDFVPGATGADHAALYLNSVLLGEQDGAPSTFTTWNFAALPQGYLDRYHPVGASDGTPYLFLDYLSIGDPIPISIPPAFTAPTFPASLPTVASLDGTPYDVLSDGQPGVSDYRQRSTVPGSIVSVEWLFFGSLYATFAEFVKTDLLNGARWFSIPLPCGQGIANHICRFDKKYEAKEIGYRAWRVSADLEIRERQV